MKIQPTVGIGEIRSLHKKDKPKYLELWANPFQSAGTYNNIAKVAKENDEVLTLQAKHENLFPIGATVKIVLDVADEEQEGQISQYIYSARAGGIASYQIKYFGEKDGEEVLKSKTWALSKPITRSESTENIYFPDSVTQEETEYQPQNQNSETVQTVETLELEAFGKFLKREKKAGGFDKMKQKHQNTYDVLAKQIKSMSKIQLEKLQSSFDLANSKLENLVIGLLTANEKLDTVSFLHIENVKNEAIEQWFAKAIEKRKVTKKLKANKPEVDFEGFDIIAANQTFQNDFADFLGFPLTVPDHVQLAYDILTFPYTEKTTKEDLKLITDRIKPDSLEPTKSLLNEEFKNSPYANLYSHWFAPEIGAGIVINRVQEESQEEFATKAKKMDSEGNLTEQMVEWMHRILDGEVPCFEGVCSGNGTGETLPNNDQLEIPFEETKEKAPFTASYFLDPSDALVQTTEDTTDEELTSYQASCTEITREVFEQHILAQQLMVKVNAFTEISKPKKQEKGVKAFLKDMKKLDLAVGKILLEKVKEAKIDKKIKGFSKKLAKALSRTIDDSGKIVS